MRKGLLLIVFFLTSFLTQAEPLPANEVFQVEVKKMDPNRFTLNWSIKPGYFLYRDRITLGAQDTSQIQLGNLRFPPTIKKTDKQGHSYRVYRNQLNLTVDILGIESGESILDLHYQGCSDDGFCYPPEDKQIKVTIDKALALAEISFEAPSFVSNVTEEMSQNNISHVFSKHEWPTILLIFYGLGLLLSFTPCVLPMVPVLSGIIVGHDNITTRKAFFLSLSYVLSMSVTYALFGAVIAVVGANLQINMQSPWIISLFSLVFVLLALSMFGVYEFKLPASWHMKITGASRNQKGGHYVGAAIMGCLSTLILSPCVTAPLIGVLSYISQTKNILLGSLTLFVLGFGMGTPLLLIGTSAGKWLPNSGAWMNVVKSFFGVLLLGVANYLLSRVVPISVSMGLWAMLLIFSGIYCGALTYSATNQEKFMQAIGIILLSYGLIVLVGMTKGASSPLSPLSGFSSTEPAAIKPAIVVPQTVQSVEEQIKQAKGKPILLDFYADWCTSCKIMEATTFKDPQVIAALSQFLVIKVDVTENNVNTQELMRHYKVIAPPTFIFLSPEGASLTLVGEVSDDEFLKTLGQIKGKP